MQSMVWGQGGVYICDARMWYENNANRVSIITLVIPPSGYHTNINTAMLTAPNHQIDTTIYINVNFFNDIK